jgi:hypothetical protein
MRHPLSTSGSGGVSKGPVAVGDVYGFVVEHALSQAVPQDFQPSVAQGPQGGVVALSGGDFAVVKLAGPAAVQQTAKRPLVNRGAEVMIVRQAAGDDEVTFLRPAGDRGGAGVALQTAGTVELVDVFADLARDPGGEQIPEPGHAQVDLTARERLARVGVLGGVIAPGAGPAEQQLGHPSLPAATGLVQGQQLDCGQPDPGSLGSHEVVPGGSDGADSAATTRSANRSGQP